MVTEQSTSFYGEVSLDHLSVLDIRGADVEKFLQGQTSAQVSLANGVFAPLTCFCTPKGRIIANGQLFRVVDNHFRLLISSTLAGNLATHLKKFAVFYRAELSVETGLALIGAGPEQASAKARSLGLTLPGNAYLQDGDEKACVLRLPGEERYLFCLEAAQPEASDTDETQRNAWQLADIQSGLAWLTDAQTDHFLPQMINWEALGGISFKKGCYTGQEVVARAHFRGQVKKRLVRAHLMSDTLPKVGQSLTDENTKGLGEVVNSAFSDEQQVALLAVVATKVMDTPQALFLEGQPVTLEEVPYPVERLDPEKLSASLVAS
ncbi:CAF17-like 4Fe-4S cluster assembly/insertion protein YgfZ [Vreelandella sp. EE22]